jgi:hypothetical protein
VERAVRLGSRLAADGYDPFLAVLRNTANDRIELWPIFWAPGANHPSLYGQFAPMLTAEEWRRLFRTFNPDFFR